jgi:hypothetical protein
MLRDRLIVVGDAAATGRNILDNALLFRLSILGDLAGYIAFVFLAIWFYRLLKDVQREAAQLMVAFVLVCVSICMVICWLLLLVLARQSAEFGAAATSQLQGLGLLLVKANDPIMSNVVGIFFSLGALMLYYLLYQARLIPRWVSVWGLVAGALTLVPSLTALFGINLDSLKFVMLPQEMVMAVWLIVKGFNLKDDSTVEAVAPQQRVATGVAPLRP